MVTLVTRGRVQRGFVVGSTKQNHSRRIDMKINQVLKVLSLAVVLALAADTVTAQDADRPRRNRDGAGQEGGGGRNFDPAAMRERMMERYKETLEITDEAEWKALEPLVAKVGEARLQAMTGGRGMFGGRGGRGGGPGGPGGGGGFGGQPNPEVEALQKAIDAKASNAETKAALAKFTAARKAKQAELEKAQADLRKVLTPRQEAIATLNGLL
jgi:hypothetical protein